ncbi:MAG: permease-like cell division protein FtsX [Bacteroidales bacterium]
MKRKERHILSGRLVQSYISSVISIALVLFLAGITALLALNAKWVSHYFRENIKVTLILSENIEQEESLSFYNTISTLPFIKESLYISKEQGREEMVELLGPKFLELFEVDPIPTSIELFLKAEYTASDSLTIVDKRLKQMAEVREVLYQESLVEVINSNMERGSYFLITLLIVFLFISFVLINNTVRLNLFSKRAIIYTMKLVGAKRSFIRKPLLIRAVWQGFFASLLSLIALVLLSSFVVKVLPEIVSIVDINLLLMLLAALPAVGVLLALISTYFIANRLISMGREDIYY